MAYTSLLLISLLLVASASISHGLTILGIDISNIRVQGILACTTTGNPVPGTVSTGVANATVLLQCGGSNTTIGQALTNPVGAYEVVIKILDTVTFYPSTCQVVIPLSSVATCRVFPPDGVLTGTITLVQLVQDLQRVFTAYFNVGKLITIVQ